jgi:hypothetical protein
MSIFVVGSFAVLRVEKAKEGTRKRVHEAMIKQADLHEVLAKCSGLDVIVVCL